MRGGREVTRIEGLSDAVFGFALALVVPMRLFWMPGFVYFLLGPVQGTNGQRTGVARARLEPSLA